MGTHLGIQLQFGRHLRVSEVVEPLVHMQVRQLGRRASIDPQYPLVEAPTDRHMPAQLARVIRAAQLSEKVPNPRHDELVVSGGGDDEVGDVSRGGHGFQ